MADTTTWTEARRRILQLCRQEHDARTLRLSVLSVLRHVAGFDAYVWLLTDPETSVGAAPLADVPCLPELPHLIKLKYLTTVNRWTGLTTPAASLSQATAGRLTHSLMWQELLCRYRVTDIAHVVLRDQFGCWGFLDLWRTNDAPAFTAQELQFLRSVAGPLTTAVRRSQAATFTAGRACGPGAGAGPVVLLLSPALEVRAETHQAQSHLRLLVPPDSRERAPVPAGAYNVGAQLLAQEARVDTNPARARVHLGDGRWLTLHAARMETGQPVHEQDIAVTIETTAPTDRLSLFARACGLSARETELLGHLAMGASTRDVARLMFLSEHTVQDHLKSIFAKTGTRTRRTVLARALGA